MEEGFIPTFEEEKNELQVNEEIKSLIVALDNLEEKIQLAEVIDKEVDTIKKNIKAAFVKFGNENNLTQVKLTTPKGIKLTCSIGKKAVFEEVTEKQFSLETVMKDYPEVYEKCCIERTYNKVIESATNDRLVVTTPKLKGEENE